MVLSMQTQSAISITVKASNESKYTISTSPFDTVFQLKAKLAVQEGCDTPPERIRLVFSGRVLKDDDTLEMYKIVEGHIIHMVRSSIATAPVPASTPASASPSMTTTMGGDGRGSDGGLINGSGLSILGNHSRASMSHTAIREMDQQLPVIMTQMMQDQNFAQYISAMLQNPQVLDSMIAMNPALRDIGGGADQIRERLRSPQFQQMIVNPDMLRDIAQMGSRLDGTTYGMNNFRSGVGSMFTPWTDLNPSLTTSTPRAPPTTAAAVAAAVSMMAGVPGQAQQTTEERFQVQLKQLNDMGFWDAAKNIRALVVAGGNVNVAIELLFSRST